MNNLILMNTNCGKSEIAFGVTQVEVLAADGVVIPATVFFDEGNDTTLSLRD